MVILTVRDPVGGVGTAAATVALGIGGGFLGVVAGFATAGLWAAVTAPYAYAGGHLLAAVVLPRTVTPVILVGVEVGFLALLTGPLQTTNAPVRAVLAFVALTAGLLAVASATKPPWFGALAIAATAALAGYAVHRYEVSALGLNDGGS